MVARGDQPGGAGGGRGVELEVDLARPGVGVEAVEQPDVARHVVDDRGAVGGRVARVEPVVIGVPAQVGAVKRGGVEVAGALVVGGRRAGRRSASARRTGRSGRTGPARRAGHRRWRPTDGRPCRHGSASSRRAPPLAGQQGGGRGGQRQVVDLAERQAARRGGERHGVGVGARRDGWSAAEAASTSPVSVQPMVLVRASPQ